MTIAVSPLHALEDSLRRHEPSHLIGLLSPDMAPANLVFPTSRRLNLAFNDIVASRNGLIAPDINHIKSLLEFLEGWDRRSTVLIHCWAGVSRSTAAAYVAACLRDGPGSEAALADRLRAAAPFATPNPLIVALADEALGREGRMSAAVAAIGRGAETSLGTPFEI